MECLFMGCENFNQPLNKWDVYKDRDFSKIFVDCKKYNKNIGSWSPSADKWTDWDHIFDGCPLNYKQPRWYKWKMEDDW